MVRQKKIPLSPLKVVVVPSKILDTMRFHFNAGTWRCFVNLACTGSDTSPPLGSSECAYKNPEKELSKLKKWWVPCPWCLWRALWSLASSVDTYSAVQCMCATCGGIWGELPGLWGMGCCGGYLPLAPIPLPASWMCRKSSSHVEPCAPWAWIMSNGQDIFTLQEWCRWTD